MAFVFHVLFLASKLLYSVFTFTVFRFPSKWKGECKIKLYLAYTVQCLAGVHISIYLISWFRKHHRTKCGTYICEFDSIRITRMKWLFCESKPNILISIFEIMQMKFMRFFILKSPDSGKKRAPLICFCLLWLAKNIIYIEMYFWYSYVS